jgi:hypothetical protein
VAIGQKIPGKKMRPDLSGTWVMEEQSDSLKKALPELSALTLLIDHHEPEIRITKKFTLDNRQHEQELIYYSDGRGEENLTIKGGKSKVRTRTEWKSGVLVFRYPDYSANISGPSLVAEQVIQWQIKEGGTVIVEENVTTYHSTNAPDASMSASDRGKLPAMPRPDITKRIYKKIP